MRAYSVEWEIPQRARTWAVRKRPGPLMSMAGGRGKTCVKRFDDFGLETDITALTLRLRLLDITLLL